MNKNYFIPILIVGLLVSSACKTKVPQTHSLIEVIKANQEGQGINIELHFEKGESHNHPTFAIWVENMQGDYIQTLFVTKYIGSGIFAYQQISDTEWDRKPGESARPAALPYWLYKKGTVNNAGDYLPTPRNPIPDAYSGATPQADFILEAKTTKMPGTKFRILMEINQTWDWNEYWTNNKYPNDIHYKTSCQPSVIYAVTVNLDSKNKIYYLNPIGHGHYSGKDGELYTDLSTLSTALEIAKRIYVRIN